MEGRRAETGAWDSGDCTKVKCRQLTRREPHAQLLELEPVSFHVQLAPGSWLIPSGDLEVAATGLRFVWNNLEKKAASVSVCLWARVCVSVCVCARARASVRGENIYVFDFKLLAP